MNSTPFKGTAFKDACIRFNEAFSLLDINWTLEPGQVWAIMGTSGSGKSALAAALTGAGEISSGTVEGIVANAGVVSLESQAELIERERLRDDSDITDKINPGTPVRDMLNDIDHGNNVKRPFDVAMRKNALENREIESDRACL